MNMKAHNLFQNSLSLPPSLSFPLSLSVIPIYRYARMCMYMYIWGTNWVSPKSFSPHYVLYCILYCIVLFCILYYISCIAFYSKSTLFYSIFETSSVTELWKKKSVHVRLDGPAIPQDLHVSLLSYPKCWGLTWGWGSELRSFFLHACSKGTLKHCAISPDAKTIDTGFHSTSSEFVSLLVMSFGMRTSLLYVLYSCFMFIVFFF